MASKWEKKRFKGKDDLLLQVVSYTATGNVVPSRQAIDSWSQNAPALLKFSQRLQGHCEGLSSELASLAKKKGVDAASLEQTDVALVFGPLNKDGKTRTGTPLQVELRKQRSKDVTAADVQSEITQCNANQIAALDKVISTSDDKELLIQASAYAKKLSEQTPDEPTCTELLQAESTDLSFEKVYCTAQKKASSLE